MKKIMFYINRISYGGAERVLVNLSSQFVAHGYEAVMVTSFRSSEEYVLDSKVKRVSLENEQIIQSRLRRNISRICKLRKICREEKPDVLISFMAEPNFRAILATRGLPVKTIVSVRNDPNKEYGGKVGIVVGKYILPLADGCVFQTDDAKQWFPKRLQKKSRIIFNAVKEEFFNVERNRVDNRIVTCGRLVGQKNHKLLIDAFSIVNEQYKEAILYIYGEGELKERLEKYIVEKKLEEKVVLKGNTDDVKKVLAEATVFVLSSDYEGMPNALMEALAVGVPCVSTDCPCGGPRMLIKNEKNGLLVEIRNEKALSDAILKVLKELTYAQYLGSEAQKMALDFKPEKIFEQWRVYVEDVSSN